MISFFRNLEYGYGTIAIFIVSILALLGFVLLPCFKKKIYEDILLSLTALAVSTLFCDAMFHLLPSVSLFMSDLFIYLNVFLFLQIMGLEHSHSDDSSDEPIVVADHIQKLTVAICGKRRKAY